MIETDVDTPAPPDVDESDDDDDDEWQECCNCGIEFGITASYKALRLRDGREFYCPNGCGQHYAESDASKLKKAQHEAAVAKAKSEKLEDKLERGGTLRRWPWQKVK